MTLDQAIDRYSNNAEYERRNGSLHGCMEFRQLAEWLKELKQLREQTRWIPVSERLPEDGTYLVTVERVVGGARIDIKSFAKDLNKVDEYDFSKHKCGWYDYDSEYGYWQDASVRAWMPLPKPYDPQESEE